MKKVVILCLCSVLIFTVVLLSGCGETAGPEESSSVTTEVETTAVSAEMTELKDNVPDLDFEGYQFRTIEQSSTRYSMYSKEENGDVINDTIYQRNIAVEDRFNVKFLETNRITAGEIIRTVKQIVMSGSDEYDLVFGQMYESARAVKDGVYIDWNQVPYVELTNPWYTKSIQDSSIGDRLFLIESDLVSSYTQQTWMILFNKDHYRSYYPDGVNLYTVVDDGQWTIDVLNNLVKNVYQDLNGNGQRDKEDYFGIASYQDGCQMAAFFYALGNKLAILNDDMTVTHTIADEKSVNSLMKLGNLFNGNVGSITQDDKIINGYGVSRELFVDEKVLFLPSQSGALLSASLREFECEFGVLPLPKYYEKQDEYFTCVDGGADILTVPVSVPEEHLEIIGAVTEAMSYLSYRDFIPAYCGEGLSVKGTRDDESMAMVRKILDSRVVDFAYLYDGFSGWVMKLPGIIAKPDTCASSITKDINSVDKYFSDFIEYMNSSDK